MNYYVDVWKKYAVFQGRASRKEYWIFCLFNLITYLVLLLIERSWFPLATLHYLYYLAIFLPFWGVGIRRLHDIGKSGWWILPGVLLNTISWVMSSYISIVHFSHIGLPVKILMGISSLINMVYIIVFCLDGQPGENQYGPNPKGVNTIATKNNAHSFIDSILSYYLSIEKGTLLRKKRIEFFTVTIIVFVVTFVFFGLSALRGIFAIPPALLPVQDKNHFFVFLSFGFQAAYLYTSFLSGILLFTHFISNESLASKILCSLLSLFTILIIGSVGFISFVPYSIYNIVKIIQNKNDNNFIEYAKDKRRNSGTRKKRIEFFAITISVFASVFVFVALTQYMMPPFGFGKTLISSLSLGVIFAYMISGIFSGVFLFTRFIANKSLAFKALCSFLSLITFFTITFGGVLSFVPYSIYNVVKIVKDKD